MGTNARRVVAALAVGWVATACTAAGARPPIGPSAQRTPGVVPTPTGPSGPVGAVGPAGAVGPGGATATTVGSTTTNAPPALAGALDAQLAGIDSCLVVTDPSTGAVLYAHDADTALAAASAQKLVVAAAALDRLGPDYRFTTTVVAAAAPADGTVDDLWLVGGGDPLLASPEYITALAAIPATVGYPTTPLAVLAAQLRAAGVRTVRRGIHGDDSRYEALRFLPTWAPSINHDELDVGPLSALEVDQGLDRWHPAQLTVDPPGHAAGVLARLLTGPGVTAAQGADGTAPAHAVVLASVRSAPLADIVAGMLRTSDNQVAELLVRELDRAAGGRGTTAGGVQVVMAAAAGLGLPVAGLDLVDGSGLSRSDRVSCRTLLAALELGDHPGFGALVSGLPVAGVSGTLAPLWKGTPLAGRLAAKGGYISGVTALVGRLSGPTPRHFALVADGTFGFSDGLGLAERVAEIVAGLPAVAPPTATAGTTLVP